MLTQKRIQYEHLLESEVLTPRPGFLAFFHTVTSMGIRVSIGSLTEEKYAVTLMKRSGLWDLFDKECIVLKEHVPNPKPAPDVFLKTAEKMGISPLDQLVFEDSPRGVQAAISAGSKAVGMPVVILDQTVGALVKAGVSELCFDWRNLNPYALIKNLS